MQSAPPLVGKAHDSLPTRKRSALRLAHPTESIASARQERHRQLVEQVGGVPRHQVLAAVGKMQIELREALLQQLGALLGAGAIVAPVDQEQWLFQVDEALP